MFNRCAVVQSSTGQNLFWNSVPPSLHTSNSPIMNTLPVQGIHWRARERIGQPLYANAKKSEVANTSFFGGLCSLKNCAPLALLLVCLPAWVWPCHRLRMRDVLHWLPVEQRKVACSSSLSWLWLALVADLPNHRWLRGATFSHCHQSEKGFLNCYGPLFLKYSPLWPPFSDTGLV